MAPMTRSTRGPSALLSPQIDGPMKSPQELNEGGWQMIATQARSEREVSEEPASSFDGSELFDRAFDDDGYGSEKPAYDGPEDHEDILHPLREAANRVGREVERFAEVLDGYNPMRATEQPEKHELTLELIEMYHGIAVDTLERLREQHSSARRRKDGARWRKKMRGFITEAVEDEMDLEEADEDESPNSQLQTTLEDLERWEQEAQTWDLLRRLVLLRYPRPGSDLKHPISHHKSLHKYSSEQDVWKSFLESDDLALERKTVLQWLRDTADESGEEIDILVQELQQNAERGDIIAHGWLHTKAAIKNQKRIHAWPQSLDPSSPDVQRANLTSSKTGPLVTQLDPDSTTRQGRKLEAQDEYFERAIWLGCYEMLRRGRSSAEIKEWCMERTEIWRAVSMSGLPDGARHDDDEGGDPAASALWRRMCYALARKGGGDEYERAVYGLLSGDIQSVEPVCRSWDDFLFVHYNALLKTQFDNYIQARNPQLVVGGQASKFGTFDAVQFHGEPKTAAAKLVEGLKVDVRTRLEASHPMKMLQGVLIGNQFEHFAYQQGLALSKFANEHGPSILIPANNEQPENQNVNRYIALDDHDSLRVLAHMLLIFLSLGVDFGGVVRQGVVENIIVAYISFLRLAGKEELIPLYCSQLSGTRRYATLCRNLIDVIDPEQRATQIKLMRELGLDVQQFVKLQSRYLVADYPDEEEGYPAKGNFNIVDNIPIYPGYDEPRVKPDFMGTEEEGIERVDLLLIRSLEWYLLVEGLWSETFLVGTMLYERFFKYMHLAAARMLAGRIPSAEIARSKTPAILGESFDLKGLEADDEDLTEVLDGSADQKRLLKQHLLSEATSYRELEKFSELLDNMETTSTLAMMIQEAQVITWQQQWRQQLGSSVQLTKDSMTAVLNGWMLTSQTDPTFKDIRETYLPEAVLGYIAIMNFAGCHLTRHFHMEVMELSTIIAAEGSDLLALFMKTGRMQEMVEAFASVSKKLLIETSRGKKTNGSKSKRLRAKGWTQELWTIKQ